MKNLFAFINMLLSLLSRAYKEIARLRKKYYELDEDHGYLQADYERLVKADNQLLDEADSLANEVLELKSQNEWNAYLLNAAWEKIKRQEELEWYEQISAKYSAMDARLETVDFFKTKAQSLSWELQISHQKKIEQDLSDIKYRAWVEREFIYNDPIWFEDLDDDEFGGDLIFATDEDLM